MAKRRAGKSRRRRRQTDERKTHRESELHNAEKLIELHGDNLRFVTEWGLWIAWNGKRWEIDIGGKISMQYAVDCMRLLVAQAEEAYLDLVKQLERRPKDTDLAARKKAAGSLLRHCQLSQNHHKLVATLAMASSQPGVAVSHKELDQHPMLLCVENGTLDLTTGKLRGHSRADLITKMAAVGYNKNAKCPTWLGFLNTVMGGNEETIAYLQRHCGFSCTGSTKEHALVFHHGDGNNGKSTFLVVLHTMFGDYAARAARGLLFRSKGGERHPTSLATLHGKRFVTCSEIEEDQEFDEALLKDLTGGDPINCRRMRENEWEFMPTHKLELAGNHKPRIKGTDMGIWRRMHLVPWNVIIADADIDVHLKEKLFAELPGILTWCVEGCMEWLKKGLSPPEAVLSATAAYRKEQDTLGQFFEERLVFDQDARIARARLRKIYERWCEQIGAMPVGHKKLAQALQRRKVVDGDFHIDENGKRRTVNGWVGVRTLRKSERRARDGSARDRAAKKWGLSPEK